ncbi:MAG: hypothetical protein QM576_10185 [Rhodopseudomonas sp.]|uniref:hypothetical protein n=1 Tax=Rhodopseudomonas sp. TaxID=1078 RepID=UPI0039E4FDDD
MWIDDLQGRREGAVMVLGISRASPCFSLPVQAPNCPAARKCIVSGGAALLAA